MRYQPKEGAKPKEAYIDMYNDQEEAEEDRDKDSKTTNGDEG